MSDETKQIWREATKTGLGIMAKAMPLLIGWVAWLAFSYGSMSSSSTDYGRRISILESKSELQNQILSQLLVSIESIKTDLTWIKQNMEKNK